MNLNTITADLVAAIKIRNHTVKAAKEEEIKVYRIVYRNFKNQKILNFAYKKTKCKVIDIIPQTIFYSYNIHTKKNSAAFRIIHNYKQNFVQNVD